MLTAGSVLVKSGLYKISIQYAGDVCSQRKEVYAPMVGIQLLARDCQGIVDRIRTAVG